MNKIKAYGIDYGFGATNIDMETGIRYGAISMNSLSPEWDQWNAEPDYGDPHCPKCGNPATTREDFDYTAECGVYQCGECEKVWYPMELRDCDTEAECTMEECPECHSLGVEKKEFTEGHGCHDHACHSCRHLFDSFEAYPDEPVGWKAKDDRYQVARCLDYNLFVLKSPYFTHAMFCSPCVPGAGDLNNPVKDGVRTYCLGHEWFDEEKAPYPVFSVKTGREVKPSK